MELDPVLLSRLQFALTIGFHFLFPPLSIGLAWFLVIVEWMGWKRNDPIYVNMGKFFGKLFALTFAIGVATGIVMEFQFGTNWAEYSKFVGDIFGAPLAAEAVFAFFLESTFLGLYLLGRNRVSKKLHWISILMVAVGSTLSAFWIIVANSWQQTPTGYAIQNGRAELTSFSEAVLNPSTLPRFFHTVDAAIIVGMFFVLAVSAWLLIKKHDNESARRAFTIALIIGLITSLAELFPFGHFHAKQVALTQPEKFASIEGLIEGQERAPMIAIGFPTSRPYSEEDFNFAIRIPGLLSFFVHDDFNAYVKGMNDFPDDELPPFLLTFYPFHLMVMLGMFFIAFTAFGILLLFLKKLWQQKWYMYIALVSVLLAEVACQLGWITAEVGRQPWIVYKELKTSDAISTTVSGGEILFSILLFGAIYLILLVLYLFLLFRHANHESESSNLKEAL